MSRAIHSERIMLQAGPIAASGHRDGSGEYALDAGRGSGPGLEALLEAQQPEAARARKDREAEAPGEALHRRVVGQHLAEQAAHAFGRRAALEAGKQQAADALALPVI